MITRSASYHVLVYLSGFAVFFLLLCTWHFSFTRQLWDQLDVLGFHFFHGWIGNTYLLHYFWAFANTRLFDIVLALMYASMLAFWTFQNKGAYWQERAARVIFIALYVIATFTSLDWWLDAQPRQSPSLLFTSTERLSELVPHLKTKDSSPHSFPSDHGFVLLMISVLSYRAMRAWLWFWLAFPVVLILPRMVAGAHWLSDFLVGSIVVAGIMLMPALAFELDKTASILIQRILDRIWRLLAQPILTRFF